MNTELIIWLGVDI